MQKPHFHKTGEEYNVNCTRDLLIDKDLLNSIKKMGAKIIGLNNYGNDTGEVVISLWIPSGKYDGIESLITEKHNFFVKNLEDKK